MSYQRSVPTSLSSLIRLGLSPTVSLVGRNLLHCSVCSGRVLAPLTVLYILNIADLSSFLYFSEAIPYVLPTSAPELKTGLSSLTYPIMHRPLQQLPVVHPIATAGE